MTKPIILIPHAPGTNRDGDAARAIELAGGEARILHLNQLREHRSAFREAQMMLLPGGFSYGDALGAGRRWALDLELLFYDELREFVESGRRVLGICNGFQVLVKAGLLPAWKESNGRRSVTLTHNESGHFECRWIHLAVNPLCRADYLQVLNDLIFCPIAHGEGNLQVRDEETLKRLESEGLVAFRYVGRQGQGAGGTYPVNPNGSVADIAGLCNAAGNVLGLMPHPENHIVAVQNPLGRQDQLGLTLFRAMIWEG
ncbi:MAG: phosphoribosylformylglycinamidine synthase I [Ardenticatenales bacterium]|nr:phosphoribosylformylglycinamidine synthase I [Ardenticatenales bacterium]